MNLTTHAFLTVALTAAATFASGCAVDASRCGDDPGCSAVEAEGLAAEGELEVAEAAAREASAIEDTLASLSGREAALARWTLRIADGRTDDCDERLLRYFEEEAEPLVLDGCEKSFLRELVTFEAALGRRDDTLRSTREAARAADRFDQLRGGEGAFTRVDVVDINVAETQWMLLGLDLANESPLTLAQERMLGVAEQLELRAVDHVAATRVDRPGRDFDPNNL